MKLLNTNVEMLVQQNGLNSIFNQIELVGRSCWMSQDSIVEDSAIPFVQQLQKDGHLSPLEHGTVYLKMPLGVSGVRYSRNPYSRYICDNTTEYITTNYRVIVENNWFDDMQYLSDFIKDKHIPRITFHFTCQRAISAEFNRHRHNSPMESSSRYCNFSAKKFGKEIPICVSDWLIKECENTADRSYFRHPTGIKAVEQANKGLEQYCYEVANGYDVSNMNIIDYWMFANLACEHAYINMKRLGATTDQAREVLPFDLKTELYHTAFLDDWIHFCELRAWDSPRNKPNEEAKKLALFVWGGLKYLKFIKDEELEDKNIEENENIENN